MDASMFSESEVLKVQSLVNKRSYGKPPFLGTLAISMAIFHSYVKLLERVSLLLYLTSFKNRWIAFEIRNSSRSGENQCRVVLVAQVPGTSCHCSTQLS